MDHIFTFSHTRTRYLALGLRFGLVLVAQEKDFGSRRSRSGQIFEIFEILGGAGDINYSISISNYCNGPYIHLLPCPHKVSSAWTEVWTVTWPSMAFIIHPSVVMKKKRDSGGLVISNSDRMSPNSNTESYH